MGSRETAGIAAGRHSRPFSSHRETGGAALSAAAELPPGRSLCNPALGIPHPEAAILGHLRAF